MASGDFDPEAMLKVLTEGEVRFILIGGMAAVLHGDVGVTVDIDVVPSGRTRISSAWPKRFVVSVPGSEQKASPKGSDSTVQWSSSAIYRRMRL